MSVCGKRTDNPTALSTKHRAMHRACPGSTVEHLAYGLFVLTIPAGGACEETAT